MQRPSRSKPNARGLLETNVSEAAGQCERGRPSERSSAHEWVQTNRSWPMIGRVLVPCRPVYEPQAFDPSSRTVAPLHGSEVETLRGSLAYQRDTLRWKCSGLTQAQLAQQCPPSQMSLGGLMKHLALVESQWFDHWFRDAGYAPTFDTMWETDREIESARDEPR